MGEDPTNYLSSILDELQKCAKCGSCRSVCPIFEQLGKEKYVTRGKVALCQAVAAGSLPLTEELKDIIDQCILCLSCVDNCSQDVRTDRIITALRADYRQLRSEKSKQAKEDLPSKMEAIGLKIVDERFKDEQSAQKALREILPEENDVENPIDTASFFTGCMADHIYQGIGLSAVRVLNKLSVSITVPGTQVCCGAPYYASGDMASVKNFAKENMERFSYHQSQKIITACATGGHMMKRIYPELLSEDEKWASKAAKFSERVCDISEYLVDYVGTTTISNLIDEMIPFQVTYHDPCHLVHGQDIASAPRQLLKLACGIKFVDTISPSKCCGAGMIYSKKNPAVSEEIHDNRLDTILESDAKAVATGCPNCMLQFSHGNKNIEVFHTIELLAQSMGLMPMESVS